MMKERLIQLYELYKIDKDLEELNELKGDLPDVINEMTEKKDGLEAKMNALKTELSDYETQESDMNKQNETLLEKIEKDDSLLRSGGVGSNKEYEALVKEMDLGSAKIKENEAKISAEVTPKKATLTEQIEKLQVELDEINESLKENQEQLEILTKENEDEEKALMDKRNEVLPKVAEEDLDFYNRINASKQGEAMAIVRKGSCLGCYSSIPPQKSIEIRMAQKFYQCEACGRILIAEELISA